MLDEAREKFQDKDKQIENLKALLLSNKELNEYDRGINIKDYIDMSSGSISVSTDVIQKIFEDLIIYYQAVTSGETGDDEEREYDTVDEIVFSSLL